MNLLERRVVIDTIASMLAPYVGGTMAAAAALRHCEKLGIDGERIDAVQLEMLLQRTRNGLVIFIGPDKSERVAAEIRAALVSQGGAS